MNHFQKVTAIAISAATITGGISFADAAGLDKGDFNGDGVIDSNDALLTLHASVSPDYLSDYLFDIADYNNDGSVDSVDALMILRESVGSNDAGDSTDYEEPDDYEEPKTTYEPSKTRTQVADMEGWSAAEVVRAVGPLFTEDQRKTGILASVSLAQFIVESGYGQSRLSLEANNCFGIKGQAGSTPKTDSPWDGVSVYIISTKEYDAYGNAYYEEASFRSYDCMEDSIEDHSRVLITTSFGYGPIYDGIVGCTDYREALEIIHRGGYATAPDYVDILCDVIEYWDLTQYDLPAKSYSASGASEIESEDSDETDPADVISDTDKAEVTEITNEETNDTDSDDTSTGDIIDTSPMPYVVCKVLDDPDSVIGRFDTEEDAINFADSNPDYNVYDDDGDCIYSS